MDIDEIKEKIEEAATENGNTFVALWVSFLAMLMAITSLGGNNAGKDMLNANIEASNLFAFYQAKTIRQTVIRTAADDMDLLAAADPTLVPEMRTRIKEQVAKYRATVERYDTEPGEGRKELLARAKELEAQRDLAASRDPYFDYAEALLQIAVVLASVSLITGVAILRWFSIGLGVIGGVLSINGFLLLFHLPFL
ncbi:MAG: DUF4337 domain-containing protein [Magnetospirillum sp.]|nr:DUF4337 domain-containing protein [Magnetospirillum sp.]